MLIRVISGGQTGVDQAGWRAAEGFSIPTGGAMPRGFLTEDGPNPGFAARYGAFELATDSRRTSSRRNVRDADATLWFGATATPAARATIDACHLYGRTHFLVTEVGRVRPSRVAAWVKEVPVHILNISGNRESESPGIGARVEDFLTAVFRILQFRDGELAEFLATNQEADRPF